MLEKYQKPFLKRRQENIRKNKKKQGIRKTRII